MAKKAARKKAAAKPKGASDDRVGRALEAAVREHRGEKLTQAQSRDLAWWRREERERITNEVVRAVPKGLFCAMAGRQHKLVDDAAERYDLPIDRPEVDLYEAIKAYHDIIAANSRFIRPADDAEAEANGELNVDEASFHELQVWELREKVRKLQRGNDRLEIALTRDRGDSIDRRELREMLGWFSTRVEGLGQQLRRCKTGPEAQKTLNEFLDSLANECEQGVLRV